MRIYHLKTCDSCKKAIKALKDHSPDLIDVRADGMPKDVLDALLAQHGPEMVVNRKSTTWRNLSDEDRARRPLDLLLENPTLMKRPVIAVDGKTYVGWGKDVQAALGVL